jgi:uncharacterized membrane protein HdeD (DUF308 family)
MRLTRRRVFLLVLALFAVGIGLLALVDRKPAYVILYVIGTILLLLGSAAGMGGGADAAYGDRMDQRLSGLSQNLLMLLAGAAFIGLAVLLQLA